MDAIRNPNTSVGRSIIVLRLVAQSNAGSSYGHANGVAIPLARIGYALSNEYTGPHHG